MGALPPVFLVFGEDEFRTSEKAKALVDELMPPAERSLGLEIVEGMADTVDVAAAALAECDQALRTPSLLGGRKMVWLRDAAFLEDNPMGRSDRVRPLVDALAGTIKAGWPPGTILLVTARNVDKRFAFYKACKAQGQVLEFPVSGKAHEDEQQARRWIAERAAEAGLRMASDVADLFVDRVGTDTRQLNNELEKLDVFLGKRREVRAEDVSAVTCASREILAWDLADAFGRRDLAAALAVLRQLLFQKENAIGLLIGLQSRVRDLMLYREALDRGWLKAARSQRGYDWRPLPADVEQVFAEDLGRDPRATHPYRVGLLATQASKFTIAELRSFQTSVLDAHRELVTGSTSDGATLERLLVRTLAAGSRRQR